MSSVRKIMSYLETMDTYIDSYKIEKEAISKASIGWHIDHSLKVINAVIKALQASDPKMYKGNFSFLGKVFFKLGFFPRGKAKAPKHVKPPEVILKEDLKSQLKLAKTNIDSIASLDKNAYFKHPLFGHINKTRVYRFLILHTNHHLKIINDITVK